MILTSQSFLSFQYESFTGIAPLRLIGKVWNSAHGSRQTIKGGPFPCHSHGGKQNYDYTKKSIKIIIKEVAVVIFTRNENGSVTSAKGRVIEIIEWLSRSLGFTYATF